jgi:hypothetical protein
LENRGQTQGFNRLSRETSHLHPESTSEELLALFNELPRDPSSNKMFPWGSVQKSFRAAVKAARLKNMNLYTLKHTAARRMIKARSIS